jgi:hypothetical protein
LKGWGGFEKERYCKIANADSILWPNYKQCSTGEIFYRRYERTTKKGEYYERGFVEHVARQYQNKSILI